MIILVGYSPWLAFRRHIIPQVLSCVYLCLLKHLHRLQFCFESAILCSFSIWMKWKTQTRQTLKVTFRKVDTVVRVSACLEFTTSERASQWQYGTVIMNAAIAIPEILPITISAWDLLSNICVSDQLKCSTASRIEYEEQCSLLSIRGIQWSIATDCWRDLTPRQQPCKACER